MRKGNVQMHFFYDAQGRPMLVRYNGIDYAYLHNLQGDIVSIVDMSGTAVVEYGYDAWGKPISTEGSMAGTLGYDNPFRYRGYVWDEETGLYSTATRYYNPEWQRFINADTLLGRQGKLLTHNAFSYVRNSPIIHVDFDGFEDVLIIYDSRPEDIGFVKQTEWWESELKAQGSNVVMSGFASIPEFIDCWNSVSQPYDVLIIISHGAAGSIDCAGGYLGANPKEGKDENGYISYHYSRLKNTISAKSVALYSCHGADIGKYDLSAAEIISLKTNDAPVRAAQNAGVNYVKGTGKPTLGPGVRDVSLDSIAKIFKWFFSGAWVIQKYSYRRGWSS